MKITSIDICPVNSADAINLSFRDPRAVSPYNVRDITGLDAGDITSQYAGSIGSPDYYSLSLVKRDIVMKVTLNPSFGKNQTFSDLRDALYRKIYSSRSGVLQLLFKNGNTPTAFLSGYFSKVETSNFDRQPEVTLTFSCNNPMLRAIDPLSVDITNLNIVNTELFDDISTAPHGITFSVLVAADAGIPSISIDNLNDGSGFTVSPIGGFTTNDLIHFSSDYDRYIYMVRGGVSYQLADAVVPGSQWPMMFPGLNGFEFGPAANLTWRDLSYYPTYWGV